MARMTVQLELDTHARVRPAAHAWAAWTPPPSAAAHGWAQELVGRVARVAVDAGLSPADLVADTYAGSALAELAAAHGWARSTAVVYAKALWAYGIAAPRLPTPEPDRGPRSLPLLFETSPAAGLAQLRTAAWAHVAAGWPAAIGRWQTLQADAVAVEGADVWVDGRRVMGAGVTWRRWMQARDVHEPMRQSAWALCTVPTGWRRSPPGVAVSLRALEDAFAAQARRAAARAADLASEGHPHDADDYVGLTYDSFRRLMLAAGAAPPSAGSRGAVRAARR